MFARMFTIEGRREQLDEFTRLGENKVLPALQRLDGFEGSLVLANREKRHAPPGLPPTAAALVGSADDRFARDGTVLASSDVAPASMGKRHSRLTDAV